MPFGRRASGRGAGKLPYPERMGMGMRRGLFYMEHRLDAENAEKIQRKRALKPAVFQFHMDINGAGEKQPYKKAEG